MCTKYSPWDKKKGFVLIPPIVNGYKLLEYCNLNAFVVTKPGVEKVFNYPKSQRFEIMVDALNYMTNA